MCCVLCVMESYCLYCCDPFAFRVNIYIYIFVQSKVCARFAVCLCLMLVLRMSYIGIPCLLFGLVEGGQKCEGKFGYGDNNKEADTDKRITSMFESLYTVIVLECCFVVCLSCALVYLSNTMNDNTLRTLQCSAAIVLIYIQSFGSAFWSTVGG